MMMIRSTTRVTRVLLARGTFRRQLLVPVERRYLSSASNSSAVIAPTPDDDDKLPSNTRLIDFAVAAKIEGEESHVATVELQPGETLRAESGAMLFMTDGVVMDTKMEGMSSAFRRMMTGQNVFLTDFSYQGESSSGTVCLGTEFPSKILRFNLQDFADTSLICQRGAFLASNPSVNIEMEFTKTLTAGFFGGQGFILQKLSGEGDVLVKGGGTVVMKELKEGETLRVTSGSIVAFEPTMQYDVQMMPGIKNAMFGGEGLFITTLTGPGRVWLQGMPPERMIAEVARRVPGGMGVGFGIPLGGGSGAGDEAAAAGDEAGAAGEGDATTSGEEMVAATDAAVDSDRQATVASSGMASDASPDSPSALFGDAAPEDDSMAKGGTDDASFATSSTEPTFTDDDLSSTAQNEPTFDEGDFSSGEFEQSSDFQDGKLFDDSPSSDSLSSESAEDSSSGGLLGTLWDMFMGGDE